MHDGNPALNRPINQRGDVRHHARQKEIEILAAMAAFDCAPVTELRVLPQSAPGYAAGLRRGRALGRSLPGPAPHNDEESDEAAFAARARRLGWDPEDYLAALRDDQSLSR
jgi:hypothetical protein